MKKIVLIALLCIVCIGSVLADESDTPKKVLFGEEITEKNILDSLTYYWGDLFQFERDSDALIGYSINVVDKKGMEYHITYFMSLVQILGFPNGSLLKYKTESNPQLFLDLIIEGAYNYIRPYKYLDGYFEMLALRYNTSDYLDCYSLGENLISMSQEHERFIENATKELDYAVKYGAMELR